MWAGFITGCVLDVVVYGLNIAYWVLVKKNINKRAQKILFWISYITALIVLGFALFALFLDDEVSTSIFKGIVDFVTTFSIISFPIIIPVLISGIIYNKQKIKNKEAKLKEEIKREMLSNRDTQPPMTESLENPSLESEETSIDIADVPELIVEKSKETTYRHKIKELFENETITEDKYDLYCYYINDKKYDKIELSEEDRQEVIEDYEAVAINLYKEQLNANKGKKTTGNLLKKNKLICNICFGVGSGLLALGIILALAVNGVAGGIIGVVGVIGLFVGFSGMGNRKKICPNCGECWGEKIDSKYMGSSQKTVQKHITKTEYNEKVKGSGSWVGTDGKGNYFERTIETTNNYVDTLKCPNCGHTWQINESHKD